MARPRKVQTRTEDVDYSDLIPEEYGDRPPGFIEAFNHAMNRAGGPETNEEGHQVGASRKASLQYAEAHFTEHDPSGAQA
jgi:hypothetical protein